MEQIHQKPKFSKRATIHVIIIRDHRIDSYENFLIVDVMKYHWIVNEIEE